MAGLDPAIHAVPLGGNLPMAAAGIVPPGTRPGRQGTMRDGVDGRDKPGHDEGHGAEAEL